MLKFAVGAGSAGETFTRATTATYKDVNGTRQTAAINVKRDGHYIGGVRTLLLEAARTNHFLNSAAPATQTTASLGTGTYTLWMEGTGSIAVAQTTATITGAGTASAGVNVTFVVTVAGTVTYTVTGSPTLAQSENGLVPSSYIPTVGAAVTRSADAEAMSVSGAPGALTVYLKFIESGSATATAATRVMEIGTNAVDPRLSMISNAGGATGKYRISYVNGATVSSTAAATPALGDTVELRGIMNADGSVQLGQSINGAAEVVAAASAAQAVGAAWSANTAYYDGTSAGATGLVALISAKILAGVRPLSEMRAA